MNITPIKDPNKPISTLIEVVFKCRTTYMTLGRPEFITRELFATYKDSGEHTVEYSLDLSLYIIYV